MFRRAITFVLILGVASVVGCTHHPDPGQELHKQLVPFTQTRDRAIAVVTSSKHSLDAPSLNQLAVSYTALEEKGNAYAGFLAESISVSSFDSNKNAEYSTKLKNAIDRFNSSFVTISPSQASAAKLATDWLPPFAQSVKSYWDRYHAALATAAPQRKATLVEQMKADTVWPNFENIATEPLASPSPH